MHACSGPDHFLQIPPAKFTMTVILDLTRASVRHMPFVLGPTDIGGSEMRSHFRSTGDPTLYAS